MGTNYVVGTNTSDIESKILNQKLSDVKVSGYNLAVLGCAATAGGCILLGNDLGSDINDMLHPDKAGSYNSIRGTIETGIKLTGLPKEYQGLATDVAYFGVSSKLASTGKWENVSNTLNNIKIPGLGGSKEVVVTDSLGNTYKVKPESVVDDLANNKVLEASKNKNNSSSFNWGNPKSKPTYGHTFLDHGSKVKDIQLIDRARSLKHQVGNWSDDKVAADFLENIAKKGTGVYDVPLPNNIQGKTFLPTGVEVKPNMARVVVKPDGTIRTAFPYNSNYPTSAPKTPK